MSDWLVFYTPTYYPRGGLDDLIGVFPSEEEANLFANSYIKSNGLEDYEYEVQVVNYTDFISKFLNKGE